MRGVKTSNLLLGESVITPTNMAADSSYSNNINIVDTTGRDGSLCSYSRLLLPGGGKERLSGKSLTILPTMPRGDGDAGTIPTLTL